MVPAESGAVLLLDEGYLRFTAAFGPHADSLMELRLPPTIGVAGYSLQTQRSVVLGQANRHPRHYRALDRINGYETRQIVAVPLLAGGVAQGILELLNPPNAVQYTSDHIAKVESVARALSDYVGARA